MHSKQIRAITNTKIQQLQQHCVIRVCAQDLIHIKFVAEKDDLGFYHTTQNCYLKIMNCLFFFKYPINILKQKMNSK